MIRGKKAILSSVVTMLLVFGGLLGYLYYRNNKNQPASTDNTVDEQRQAVEQASESTKSLYYKQAEEISQQTQAVTSVEELAKLDSRTQANVGLSEIDQAIGAGDYQKANQYIDYVMKRTDIVGIEAAMAGYHIADTDARKQQCVDRMNEIARSTGMIGPNDTLPSSYYQTADGGQG